MVSKFRAVLQAIRIHQWVKNLIVFVPLLASHKIVELDFILGAIEAFFAFSLAASIVYVFNDLSDLTSDRQHRLRRKRPFASGTLSPKEGCVLISILFVVGTIIGFGLPKGLVLVLLLYLTLNIAYSLYLKRVLMLDVFCLSVFYTLRVLAGHEATGIPYSVWLIAFSMFLFLSLALIKRLIEIHDLAKPQLIQQRPYRSSDALIIAALAGVSGFLSVLIIPLYINSGAFDALYLRPGILWLSCPVLLYWISRLIVLAFRKEIQDDPVVFAVKDKVSYLVAAALGLTVVFSV